MKTDRSGSKPDATKIAKAGRARKQARAFFLAAKRCNESLPVPSGHLQSLDVPTLVLYAFSVELGLKALAIFEAGKAAQGHDLKKLLGTLSPGLQARIVARTGHPKFFDSGLDLVREAFKVWRYIHEREHNIVETDLGFLQRFAAATQMALREFP